MNWYYDDHDNQDYDAASEKHETPPNAIILEGPVRASNPRGEIGREWWGKQWIKAMERLGLDARMVRGKTYARNGSVLRLEIGHGEAYALVEGSYGRSYHTKVFLRTLDDEQWDQALQALSAQAIYAAKLLAGDMPEDIETIFQHVGLSLFPQKKRDLNFDCSCPDWGDPCKHSAAVYYLLADMLDSDPFVLFHLRGRSRDQILSMLRKLRDETDSPADTPTTAASASVPPLDVDLSVFWSGAAANIVRQMPNTSPEPLALRLLGSPPGGVENEIRRIYHAVAQEARTWLGLGEGN
ncbi:MAG: SWIM zinc finger family protein [Anaerolineae bacterium]|nr:SWIM zinc finger family protein [Anaerolineae bacterium]